MASHRLPTTEHNPTVAPPRNPVGRSAWMSSAGVATFAAMLGMAALPGSHLAPASPRVAAIGWSDLLAEGTTPQAAHKEADPEQRVLAEFLAKRYRVAQEATDSFVAAAFRAGREQQVDPLLVLAVMAVESRFNPVAESVLGAKGLMQVLPKYHQDKLSEHGGEAALLDPVINIQVGTRILREYLMRAGELEAGLQLYVGASDEPLAQYAGKVLGERARMAQLLARHRRSAA